MNSGVFFYFSNSIPVFLCSCSRMVFEGSQKLDPEFKRIIVRLYWSVSTAVGSKMDLTPDERLLVTAAQIGSLDPARRSPFNTSELARHLRQSDSTIRDRVRRLIERGYLERSGRFVTPTHPRESEALFATFANHLFRSIGPLTDQIRSASRGATIAEPPMPIGLNPTIHGEVIVDDPLRYRIARLFFDVSIALEELSGMDAMDRLIVLTVLSARAQGQATNIRSMADALGLSKSTISDRTQRLIADHVLVDAGNGLEATPDHAAAIYDTTSELFLYQAAPVIEMVRARMAKT